MVLLLVFHSFDFSAGLGLVNVLIVIFLIGMIDQRILLVD